MHTVKCFQVLLYNIHYLASFFAHIVCSIWPIHRTLSGATTPIQSGPGRNDNEEVLHIPQISKAGASLSDSLMPCWGLLLYRDAVGLFYSPSRQGNGLFIFTNPSVRAGYDTRSIFKRSLTGLNSEFSFSLTISLTMAGEPSLSYYLPITGGRIIGFIPFPRVLVQCEMQSVSFRIWNHVDMSISYDDNHYTS